MSHVSACSHCGHDLSNAPRSGAAALRCPNCGAEQVLAARPAGPPPRPPARTPGGAPLPPARAPFPSPSDVQTSAQEFPPARPAMPSPFGLAPSAPQHAAPTQSAPSASSNPFLDVPITPASAPIQEIPARAEAREVAPRVIPPPSGAPLRVAPGAVSPNVRDPHAEFRRGNWKKPAAFVAVAAAALGALFFGFPSEEPARAEASASVPSVTREGAIGASLPPERIVDDGPELAAQAAKFQKEVEAKPATAPERPAGIAREQDFSQAFKAAASH